MSCNMVSIGEYISLIHSLFLISSAYSLTGSEPKRKILHTKLRGKEQSYEVILRREWESEYFIL